MDREGLKSEQVQTTVSAVSQGVSDHNVRTQHGELTMVINMIDSVPIACAEFDLEGWLATLLVDYWLSRRDSNGKTDDL